MPGGGGALEPSGTVLVVDDDEQMRRLVRRVYEHAGWAVLDAADGHQALRQLYDHRPDVVVLDVGMADLDGWETLARIRELTQTPVVMLSGQAGEVEKVRALRAGADDYVTKPFGRQELVARTEAVMRRAAPHSSEPDGDNYFDDRLGVNYQTRVVTVEGEEVSLTPLEFRLLGAFVRHPNHVLSAQQLLHLVWDNDFGTRDQVKVTVGYLRRKLGPVADRLETIRGFGYRYRPADRRLTG